MATRKKKSKKKATKKKVRGTKPGKKAAKKKVTKKKSTRAAAKKATKKKATKKKVTPSTRSTAKKTNAKRPSPAKRPSKAKAAVTKPKGKGRTSKTIIKTTKKRANVAPKKRVYTPPQRPIVEPEIPWSEFFTPLDDRVLIAMAGASKQTPGGLYIPESVAERPNKGKVVSIGPGHKDKKGRMRPMDVKVGDEVLLNTHTGLAIDLNGVEVVIVREDEILGIVT